MLPAYNWPTKTSVRENTKLSTEKIKYSRYFFLIKYHAVKNGQLQAPGKETPLHIGQEAGRAPTSDWTL
jgi:hypothetical protein